MSETLKDIIVFHPTVHEDSRGYFMELWNQYDYVKANIPYFFERFVQDNVSFSHQNVFRGLHFQNPNPQGKLVSVLQGEVFDIVVDLRQKSKTFKKWQGFLLSDKNHTQIYIPPGFAHGFVTLSITALFHYRCTNFYYAEDEQSIRWNDPELDIKLPVDNPILSQKDAEAKLLKEIQIERLFD